MKEFVKFEKKKYKLFVFDIGGDLNIKFIFLDIVEIIL